MAVTRIINLIHHAVDTVLNKAYGLAPPSEPDHFTTSRQTPLSTKLTNVRAGRSADTPDHQWPENADYDRYGITPEDAQARGLIALPDVTAPKRATSLSLQGLNVAAVATGVTASAADTVKDDVGHGAPAHRRDFH